LEPPGRPSRWSFFRRMSRSPGPPVAALLFLSGGLGPGHPFDTDYGDAVGGGACRHREAKPPDAPRPDLADVPIPAPGHAAALVQPLDPDPNAPGVHRSVVEHTPTHRLQARNRWVYLPLYPQGRSSRRFLSLACRWAQGQQAHESQWPHQSRGHTCIRHSITWSARCRRDGGIVRPRALAVLRLMTSSNVVG